MDKKYIAEWQGHQDGGQLILDTYTQVFGSDDEEYVRGQLAKIGGVAAVPVVTPSGAGVGEATSGNMKKPKVQAPPSALVTPPAPPENPYQKGDKVKTACKGADVGGRGGCGVQGRGAGAHTRWGTTLANRADGTTGRRAAHTPPEAADIIVAEKEVSKPVNGAKVARIRKRRPKK